MRLMLAIMIINTNYDNATGGNNGVDDNYYYW